LIKERIFEGIEELDDCFPDWELFSKQALEWYKIEANNQEDDEPREVHIPEMEGERVIEGP